MTKTTQKQKREEYEEFTKLLNYFLNRKKISWPYYGQEREDVLQHCLLACWDAEARGKGWDPNKGAKATFVNLILSRYLQKLAIKKRLLFCTSEIPETPYDGDLESLLEDQELYSLWISSLSEEEVEDWDALMRAERFSALRPHAKKALKNIQTKASEFCRSHLS